MSNDSAKSEPTHKLEPTHGGDILTLGFATTVAMWAVGYFGRLPGVQAPIWVLMPLMFGLLILGGRLAGRWTGRGLRGGLWVGLLASTLNTLAGAICGAIPPLIGWSAVTGGVQGGGWWLALLLFVWQVPHFLSLAWLYRDDYRRAGFRMLPLQDPRGDRTFRFLMLYAWVLLPLGLLATFMGLTGAVFAVGSLLLGGAWLWLGVRCYRDRSSLNARRVFLGSVVYLPLVLGLMVADRAPPREEPATAVVEVAPPDGSA